MSNNSLKPLLKYPGGKTSELKIIEEYMPSEIDSYIEPFVGGGAVYFYLNHKNNYINDKSEELMLLYQYVKNNNKDFYDEMDTIISNWDKLGHLASDERIYELYLNYRKDEKIDMYNKLLEMINIEQVPMFTLRNNVRFEKFLVNCLLSKFKLIRKNEIIKKEFLDEVKLKENLEAGIKASYYTYIRDAYNNPEDYNGLSKERKVALYLFIREYCFSSMFRFNRLGGFNVPYGGVSYNKKTLKQKQEYYKSEELRELLKNTEMYNDDFYDFLKKIKIQKNDFMFLDPPYDTTFSEYDKNSFGMNDQERLAKYLTETCPCKFMLIIKKTDFIESLYKDKGLTIIEEDKNYFVSFKNRNKKKVKHMIIMNY